MDSELTVGVGKWGRSTIFLGTGPYWVIEGLATSQSLSKALKGFTVALHRALRGNAKGLGVVTVVVAVVVACTSSSSSSSSSSNNRVQ